MILYDFVAKYAKYFISSIRHVLADGLHRPQHSSRTKNVGKLTQYTAKIVIQDLRADMLISAFKPILGIQIIRTIQKKIEESIKTDILRSGSTQNPRLLGIKSVVYPMIGIIIATPITLTAFFVSGDIVWAGASTTPILFFGLYFVILKTKTAERKAAIRYELAPFAALTSIMESVNISLFSTLIIISKAPTNTFAVMKKEGRRIRNMYALGITPINALMDLAATHPNSTFRDFLEGYVSAFNTGGMDTAQYLQEQSRRFFTFMQADMNRYTKQADGIAQLILVIMLLLPMMGLSMIFFATGQLAQTVMVLLIMMFPLITVILVVVIQAWQPINQRNNNGDHAIKSTKKLSWASSSSPSSLHIWIIFPIGITGGILAYTIQQQIWLGIGCSVVITCFLNMFFMRKKLREATLIDDSLPEFMRQMTRFKNIGVDVIHAIKNIRQEIAVQRGVGVAVAPLSSSSSSSSAATALSKRFKFNAVFDNLIDIIYKKMAKGASLEQAVYTTKINSQNARLIFFILSKVHESGGGTAKVLDDITRWITQYADAKKEMMANLRGSLITAFVGPVLMVMMSTVATQLTAQFEENSIGEGPSGIGISLPSIASNIATTASLSSSEYILALSDILTITTVVCMGVILSKLNYFTIRHTMFTGIITSITVVLLYVAPHIKFEL